jgi:hypothetical protein
LWTSTRNYFFAEKLKSSLFLGSHPGLQCSKKQEIYLPFEHPCWWPWYQLDFSRHCHPLRYDFSNFEMFGRNSNPRTGEENPCGFSRFRLEPSSGSAGHGKRFVTLSTGVTIIVDKSFFCLTGSSPSNWTNKTGHCFPFNHREHSRRADYRTG